MVSQSSINADSNAFNQDDDLSKTIDEVCQKVFDTLVDSGDTTAEYDEPLINLCSLARQSLE